MTDNRDDGVLIGQFLEHLELRGRTPRTRTDYRRHLCRHSAWLHRQREANLLTAAPDDLAAWRKMLTYELGIVDNSVLNYATPVRGFYGWARRTGRRTDDPALDLILPAPTKGIPHPIGEADLEMAIATAAARLRPWLVLAGYAGLRAVEIAYLLRDRILDTAQPPMIMLGDDGTKGNRWRTVPMSPYVWTELQAAEPPRRGFVFRRRDGRPGPNTPGLVSKLCNEHLHEIGLDASLHSLRHRFGTQALKASGGNLRIVQELLGHASPVTTQIYTAFSSPEAVATVNAIQPGQPIPQPAH